MGASRLEPFGQRFEDGLDGPAWDGSGLLFCVPRRNEIRRWDEGSREIALARWATVRTRGLAFAPDGRLYGAQARARRVMWFADDGASYFLNATLDGQRHNDPQDLVVDSGGRIWFTDHYAEESIPGPVGYPPMPHSSVLRLVERKRRNDRVAGEWTLERMTFDTTAPSGIALAPDHRTLYVADRSTSEPVVSTLKAYKISRQGVLGPPKVTRKFPIGQHAGGLCVDRHGEIAIAISTGENTGCIVIVDADGAVQHEIELADRPTNCCLGGPQNATLFVTTEGGQLYRSEPPREETPRKKG